MKEVKVQKLTDEAFKKFGTFSAMVEPFAAEATGPKDSWCVFFRDMVQQDLGGKMPSYSTCRVLPREFVVTAAEFHNHTGEVAMPLDGDAIIWFAPASPDKTFPADKVEAFLVPQGTIVYCKPGVWHHAAFSTSDKPLNVLIVLPERTYFNDVYCIDLQANEQVAIKR